MMEDMIENWSMQVSHRVGISVYRTTLEYGEIYNPHITFILDVDEDETPTKAITIATDIFEDNAISSIKIVLESVSTIFESIADAVPLWDEDGDEIETFSLNEIMAKKSKIRVKQ